MFDPPTNIAIPGATPLVWLRAQLNTADKWGLMYTLQKYITHCSDRMDLKVCLLPLVGFIDCLIWLSQDSIIVGI